MSEARRKAYAAIAAAADLEDDDLDDTVRALLEERRTRRSRSVIEPEVPAEDPPQPTGGKCRHSPLGTDAGHPCVRCARCHVCGRGKYDTDGIRLTSDHPNYAKRLRIFQCSPRRVRLDGNGQIARAGGPAPVRETAVSLWSVAVCEECPAPYEPELVDEAKALRAEREAIRAERDKEKQRALATEGALDTARKRIAKLEETLAAHRKANPQ